MPIHSIGSPPSIANVGYNPMDLVQKLTGSVMGDAFMLKLDFHQSKKQQQQQNKTLRQFSSSILPTDARVVTVNGRESLCSCYPIH